MKSLEIALQPLGRRVLAAALGEEEAIAHDVLHFLGTGTQIPEARADPVDRPERRSGHHLVCQFRHMLSRRERRAWGRVDWRAPLDGPEAPVNRTSFVVVIQPEVPPARPRASSCVRLLI